jgi:uncharacterized membrane protein YphA (DoxX/SURF4 family)
MTSDAQANAVSRPNQTVRILVLLGRLILGGIFVYAAYAKLRNPWMLFGMSLDSYHMFPDWAIAPIARSMPWVEMTLGLLLLAGWGLQWVGVCASLMLVAFIGAMIHAQSRGLAIDCGCFGIGERLGPKTYLRDGLFVALALAVTVGAFVMRRTQRASSV